MDKLLRVWDEDLEPGTIEPANGGIAAAATVPDRIVVVRQEGGRPTTWPAPVSRSNGMIGRLGG
jgi:hypothetical protein